jgi:peptidoglycan/LPS O-acetylase OafA/YrhL
VYAVITVALAMLSSKFIEQPFNKLKTFPAFAKPKTLSPVK